MLLNNSLSFLKFNLSSLLISSNNCFFIFDTCNFKMLHVLLNFFKYGNVFHISYLKGFYFFDSTFFNLFSGNSFMCFVNKLNFFDYLLNLDLSIYVNNGINLMAICYSNFFLNFNIKYFNLFNVFFTNVVMSLVHMCLYIYLFFLKIFFCLYFKIKKC